MMSSYFHWFYRESFGKDGRLHTEADSSILVVQYRRSGTMAYQQRVASKADKCCVVGILPLCRVRSSPKPSLLKGDMVCDPGRVACQFERRKG
jgi:hypothetical protein